MSGSEVQEQSGSVSAKQGEGETWPDSSIQSYEQQNVSSVIPSQLDDALNHVVKLRGLPWETTVDNVSRFMSGARPEGLPITEKDIYLIMGSNGRCAGEAFVQLQSSDDQEKVMLELHGKLMGRRWIEIFKSSKAEMESARERGPIPDHRGGPSHVYAGTGGVLKLRGLPWGATEFDIIRFFSDGGFSLDASQIAMPLIRGRASGEAYVDFGSSGRAEEAKRVMNRRTIGSRYIEIFTANPRDFADALRSTESGPLRFRRGGDHDGPYGSSCGTPGPYSSSGGESPNRRHSRSDIVEWGSSIKSSESSEYRYGQLTSPGLEGYTVLRMRGLPFNATANSIVHFFEGFSMNTILPTTVPVDGKPSGEAYVEFRSAAEAARAFRMRQKARMEHRYIELFPSTKEEMEMAANGWDSREIRARLTRQPAAGTF